MNHKMEQQFDFDGMTKEELEQMHRRAMVPMSGVSELTKDLEPSEMIPKPVLETSQAKDDQEPMSDGVDAPMEQSGEVLSEEDPDNTNDFQASLKELTPNEFNAELRIPYKYLGVINGIVGLLKSLEGGVVKTLDAKSEYYANHAPVVDTPRPSDGYAFAYVPHHIISQLKLVRSEGIDDRDKNVVNINVTNLNDSSDDEDSEENESLRETSANDESASQALSPDPEITFKSVRPRAPEPPSVRPKQRKVELFEYILLALLERDELDS